MAEISLWDNSLFSLATLVAIGLAAGRLIKRLHLPSVTGQILAGVLLGPAGLGWLAPERAHGLQPVVHFALGLIAVAVGSHLQLHRLGAAGRRLRWLLLAECIVVPAWVIVAVRVIGGVDLVVLDPARRRWRSQRRRRRSSRSSRRPARAASSSRRC